MWGEQERNKQLQFTLRQQKIEAATLAAEQVGTVP